MFCTRMSSWTHEVDLIPGNVTENPLKLYLLDYDAFVHTRCKAREFTMIRWSNYLNFLWVFTVLISSFTVICHYTSLVSKVSPVHRDGRWKHQQYEAQRSAGLTKGLHPLFAALRPPWGYLSCCGVTFLLTTKN